MQVTWIESKTSSQKMMSFCNHKESYDLCPIFSLFMYMISGIGTSVQYDKQYVFPSLSPSNAAGTIPKILRSGLNNVSGVQKDLSSKDLRYSAANTMLLNAGMEVCVALGGWGIEVMTDRKTGAMHVYILVLFLLICQGSRVLCKWSNYKKAYAAPSLESVRLSLHADHRIRLNNLLIDLMHLGERGHRFQPQSSNNVLWPFVEASFATYLV